MEETTIPYCAECKTVWAKERVGGDLPKNRTRQGAKERKLLRLSCLPHVTSSFPFLFKAHSASAHYTHIYLFFPLSSMSMSIPSSFLLMYRETLEMGISRKSAKYQLCCLLMFWHQLHTELLEEVGGHDEQIIHSHLMCRTHAQNNCVVRGCAWKTGNNRDTLSYLINWVGTCCVSMQGKSKPKWEKPVLTLKFYTNLKAAFMHRAEPFPFLCYALVGWRQYASAVCFLLSR